MIEITRLQQHKVFTHQEAEELLPLIYRMTESSNKEIKYIKQCMDALPPANKSKWFELELKMDQEIDRWNKKIERLGLKPKGVWLADFDNGEGFFCWKFPETQILYKHGYQDGFSGRILVQSEKIKKDYEHESSPNSN